MILTKNGAPQEKKNHFLRPFDALKLSSKQTVVQTTRGATALV